MTKLKLLIAIILAPLLAFGAYLLLRPFISPVDYQTEQLFKAIGEEAWENALYIAKNKEIDIAARDERGMTFIHLSNSPELTQTLIDLGSDVNWQAAGKDPKLARVNYLKPISPQLKKALDENYQPKNKLDEAMIDMYRKGKDYAPLHTVKDAKTIQVLLKNGANPNIKDTYGQNPLFHTKDSEVVTLLIAAGTDVNDPSGYGNTILSDVVDKYRFYKEKHESGVPIVMIQLLNAGADPNITNKMGVNALHKVGFAHPSVLLKTLLENGGNPRLETKFGKPFCQAIKEDLRNNLLTYLGKNPFLLFDQCEGMSVIEFSKAEANKNTQDFLMKAKTIVKKENQKFQ